MLQGIASRSRIATRTSDGQRCRRSKVDPTSLLSCYRALQRGSEDGDWFVRRAAVEALQGRFDLSPEMLQGIASRLEDSEGDVRRTAVEALKAVRPLWRDTWRSRPNDGDHLRCRLGARRCPPARPIAYAVVFASACLVAGLGVLFLTAFGQPS